MQLPAYRTTKSEIDYHSQDPGIVNIFRRHISSTKRRPVHNQQNPSLELINQPLLDRLMEKMDRLEAAKG